MSDPAFLKKIKQYQWLGNFEHCIFIAKTLQFWGEHGPCDFNLFNIILKFYIEGQVSILA